MDTTTATPPQPPTQSVSFADFAPKERPTRQARAPREDAPAEPKNAPEPRTTPKEAARDQDMAKAVEEATPKKFAVEGTFTDKLREFSEKNKETLKNEIRDAAAKVPVRPKEDSTEEPKPETKKLASEITADSTDAELDTHIETNGRNLSRQQLHQFKTLTYETREQKRALKEMDTLKAKLAEFEGKPAVDITPLQKSLEALKKRAEEQEVELGATRYEKTEAYQREVAVPMQNLETQFKELATEFEISPEAIAEAAKLKGKARGNALAELALEMTDYDRTKFYGLVDQYSALVSKRSEIQTKGKEAWDSYVAQQEQERKAKELTAKAEYESAVPQAWEDDIAKHLPFLKPVDGDEEWNSRLEKTRTFAKASDIRALAPKDLAAAAHRVAVYPMLVERIATLEEKLAAKSEKVESMKASKPSASSGKVNGTPAEKSDANETLTERFAKFRASRGIR